MSNAEDLRACLKCNKVVQATELNYIQYPLKSGEDSRLHQGNRAADIQGSMNNMEEDSFKKTLLL